MKWTILAILLSFFLFICQINCTTNISGGGGSETTNNITVCIRNNHISGKAAPGAHVEVYCDTFNPVKQILPDSLKIVADSSGRFSFSMIEDGKYNIYSYYDSVDTFFRTLFISTLPVPSDTTVQKTYEQAHSLSIILKEETKVQYPASLSTVNLYLKGSPFYINQDLRAESMFAINQIPEGVYECHISYSEMNSPSGIVYILPDSIEVNADTTKYSNHSDSLIIKVKQW
ncbi:MAG: hypothetical protein JW915_18905 [Chitinispirillaceae bacterium]|nr:hypothetical protein [Chitinispirillaceae bacterium]